MPPPKLGLHGSPWDPAAGEAAHLRRAAAFMLFTEAEPSHPVPHFHDLRGAAGAARQPCRVSGLGAWPNGAGL